MFLHWGQNLTQARLTPKLLTPTRIINSQALRPRRTNISTDSDAPPKKKMPSVPRPSASLLLVNKNDEVLMIQRTLSTRNFAGMHAFPGGNFDPKQDADDFRMTALRETFEETGILLVEPTTATTTATTTTNASPLPPLLLLPEPEQLAAARLAIHSRTDPLTLPDFLAQHRLRAPVDRLVPFSQWVTPESAAVRFHTRFFVLFVEELGLGPGLGLGLGLGSGGEVVGGVVKQAQRTPSPLPPPTPKAKVESIDEVAAAATATDANVLVQNPTADGGVEVISASWIHPRELFAAFRRGELALFPPQFYLLTTLGDLLTSMHQEGHQGGGSNRTAVLRSRVGGGGGFGSRVFNPRPIGFTEEGGKGQRSILAYEGDELRGGKAGDRHRCLILYQGRRIADIELQRNIDVLTPRARLDGEAKL